MREVTSKELQRLNDKSIKAEKKIFRRRLREIAANGSKQADFDKGHFDHEDEIITWLRSLGFKVTAGTYKYYITWPEEEDICEKIRREGIKIMTQPKSATVHYAIGWLNSEFGTWKFDPYPCDYVCSACGKHSEYKTDFCCNCGKKMMNKE